MYSWKNFNSQNSLALIIWKNTIFSRFWFSVMKRSSNHLAKISWGNVSYITIGLLYLKTWSKLQTQISKNGYLMNPKILTDFVPNQCLTHDQPNTLFISTDPLLHLVSSLTQSLIWSASIKRLFDPHLNPKQKCCWKYFNFLSICWYTWRLTSNIHAFSKKGSRWKPYQKKARSKRLKHFMKPNNALLILWYFARAVELILIK